jgi:hypothetical protein
MLNLTERTQSSSLLEQVKCLPHEVETLNTWECRLRMTDCKEGLGSVACSLSRISVSDAPTTRIVDSGKGLRTTLENGDSVDAKHATKCRFFLPTTRIPAVTGRCMSHRLAGFWGRKRDDEIGMKPKIGVQTIHEFSVGYPGITCPRVRVPGYTETTMQMVNLPYPRVSCMQTCTRICIVLVSRCLNFKFNFKVKLFAIRNRYETVEWI